MKTATHKRGDTFARALTIPAEFADGYFAQFTPACQIRTMAGELVSTAACEWDDALTTRRLYIVVQDTTGWPAGEVVQTDVQFKRSPDETVLSTTTGFIRVLPDVTEN